MSCGCNAVQSGGRRSRRRRGGGFFGPDDTYPQQGLNNFSQSIGNRLGQAKSGVGNWISSIGRSNPTQMYQPQAYPQQSSSLFGGKSRKGGRKVRKGTKGRKGKGGKRTRKHRRY